MQCNGRFESLILWKTNDWQIFSVSILDFRFHIFRKIIHFFLHPQGISKGQPWNRGWPLDKTKHSKPYLPQSVLYIENICGKNRDSQLVVHKLILSQSSCFALFCSPVFRVWTSDLPTTPADHWSAPSQVARLAKGAFCPSPSKCAPAASSSCFPVRIPEELVALPL